MTVAAVAAFAIAAPASATEIRIPTAGKSVAQLDAEITRAARSVCQLDTFSDTKKFKACYKLSLESAKTQLNQYAAAQDGQKLASR